MLGSTLGQLGHLAVCLLLGCALSAAAQQPRAVTENGPVVGRFASSYSGRVFRSFEGVPYARPPVGDLRFKEPQILEKPWLGEWNATEAGSPCLQYSHFVREKKEGGGVKYGVFGDEDCLFLNVYTPDTGNTKKSVVVWIHGGAFMFGYSTLYEPHYLMDRDDIVFVTINYRLGPLGFLSTGDGVVPGNNGLKDQAAALGWVQRNIAAFGGDPGKVAIAGLSAGGASVHFHYLSPLSEGLFSRGYSYSGTALCPWAMVTDAPQRTQRLATLLGCPTADPKALVKCLRRRPARQLVAAMSNFQGWLYNPFTVFGPVVEVGGVRPFLDQHPRDIITSGKAKDLPWVSGVTSEEGLYPAGDFVDNDELLAELDEKWKEVAPTLLFYSPRLAVADKLRQSYLGKERIARKTVAPLVQLLSDRLFIAPAVEAARLQAQANTQPVYAYLFRYQGSKSLSQLLSFTDNLFGVCHADDMAYVVKFYGVDTHVTERDSQMAGVLHDLFSSYLDKGSIPKALQWEPVPRHPSDTFRYLDIASPDEMTMRADNTLGNLQALSRLIPEGTAAREEL